MTVESIINERLSKLKLFGEAPELAEVSVDEFSQTWRELGREILEQQLQRQIEKCEAKYDGAHHKRSRRYQSPLGTIELSRRVYGRVQGTCRADHELGLPADGWFISVKELSSALGVSSEFAHANALLQRWSGIDITTRTLANHVEDYGQQLIDWQESQTLEAICPIASSLSCAAIPAQEQPVFYIGADGIHTPMQQGSTCEAKVGVMFWAHHHWRLSQTRCAITQREYIATLTQVDEFREQLERCYSQSVQQQPHQVVFLGDGAAWIWAMATLLFPQAIQILDFFHVSEYLWEVARHAFVGQESAQRDWVETQQQALKDSQWLAVVEAAQRLPPTSKALQDRVETLERYLNHNQTRIDYRRYLQQGLMIGSGVVESSNRRIVTQRLKQSGMFWSKSGAEAVMRLRACYLSSSQRWHDFWYK